MKSFVGYSQGTGKNIATHEVEQGADIVHFQRFSPGSGEMILEELIHYTSVTANSQLIDCTGAGRIVLSINQDTDGSELKLALYDKFKNSLGIISGILPTKEGINAYDEVLIGWSASTSYPKGTIRKISSTSHVYLQTADNGVSGGTEPIWPVDGTTVVDGTAVWKDVGPYAVGFETTPITIISNSVGACYFKVILSVISGNIAVFGGSV